MVSLGLFVMFAILGAALVLGQFLDRKRISWFGEAAGALGLGVLIGLIIRLSGSAQQVHDLKKMMAFRGDFFLYVLLPPIMFDAGFNLDFNLFVANLVPITLFAFLGTTISMLLIGVTMWAAGVWGWIHPLSPLKAMLFGSMVSATDPVTVLAVFKKLGARQDLYMIVFGESVLNDAVGIVLYQTVTTFLDGEYDVSVVNIFRGIGLFLGIFLASTVMGVIFGFLVSSVMVPGFFRHPAGPAEAGFVVVTALCSYFAAQAAGLSGIVSIMFCGITMDRATKPHLNPDARHQMEAFFHVAANLAELFVFVYIGAMLFLDDQEWHIVGFTGISLVALAHSRAAHIFPFSLALNTIQPKEKRIDAKQQFMLWWSGLRGGVAFALGVSAAKKYGRDGKFMETCIFLLCVLTVLVNGGAAPWLLQRLGLLQSQMVESMEVPPAGYHLKRLSKKLHGKYPKLEGGIHRLASGVGLYSSGVPGQGVDKTIRGGMASKEGVDGSVNGDVSAAKLDVEQH